MEPTALLRALGEQYSAAILCATRTPKSAQELSDELDVPIATCYRRIEVLVEADLLKEEGRQLSDRGRRTSVYRRTVDDLTVAFAEDGPEISTTERSEAMNRLHDTRPNIDR